MYRKCPNYHCRNFTKYSLEEISRLSILYSGEVSKNWSADVLQHPEDPDRVIAMSHSNRGFHTHVWDDSRETWEDLLSERDNK